ncbi:MAG: fumarylacetoacetase [Alphaproteobacteria bacterium]|nr:fumarylacetoacetase [Alphaproteobacteria bacterium]
MTLKSWVESANTEDTDFPIQNLPYGVISTADRGPRCAVAIGDQVLDLAILEDAGLIDAGAGRPVFDQPAMNDFMALGKSAWSAMRQRLTDLLADGGNPALRKNSALQKAALLSLADARPRPRLPVRIGDYTDFYASYQHAFNVGSMFRGPENALPPNWLHIPIGYNGRASTVVVSGTDIRRPLGQMKPHGAAVPIFGPCRRLDVELEMGAVVGTPNHMGEPVTVAEADDMIFGFVLLNDWSARDIQAWEYQPLGPFQAKVFATSISPWIIPSEALEPFRVPATERKGPLLPYLADEAPRNYDIELEILMQPDGAAVASTISRTNFRYMYYSAAQQLCHHAVGGCLMNTGDLLGSGTISGPDRAQFGSLLELSWGGKEPLTLDTGETRTFLEDGDVMTLRGHAQGDGYRIGFGDCIGRILPAPDQPSW